ncbi:MAG: DEAD/DEAH box helicase [Armatimonadetes bacterium]|nr:DEAD/DEAH box helicase [Armatimonadota bacterium]
MTFKEFGLHAALLRGLEDQGFTEPTPIQRDSIPLALQHRDLLACAMTGSGKTAAFLLPIMNDLIGKRRGTTRALILTPTRELAAQIDEHLRLLARHTEITSAAVFGGVGMDPQVRAFRKGADILIATPGRLLDHMRQPYARLDGLEHLVLDEADRMLDMGFLPDIRRILKALPTQRQTYFFSATMPPAIASLAREMLKNPATLNIERQAAPATGITHAAYFVPQTMKSPLLVHLLQRDPMESVVVFTRTKHRANRLADYLVKHGITCARIHGNRSQSQRTLALGGFKNREFRVLVATDIAARGIDVEALSHVVNFDVPHVAEDYIHRVGRTARAEATGDAVTFVSPDEAQDFNDIEKALGKRIPRLETPALDTAKIEEQRPETPVGERLAAHRRQHTSPHPARNEKDRRAPGKKAAPSPARQAAERTPVGSATRNTALASHGKPASRRTQDSGHSPSRERSMSAGKRFSQPVGAILSTHSSKSSAPAHANASTGQPERGKVVSSRRRQRED